MLNIYYGDMEEAVYNTAVYFKNTYEDNWITEPIVRDIIKDVDKSEVIDFLNPIQALSALFRFGYLQQFSFQ